MNGWLIYDAAGAKRNEWFIRRLIDEAEQAGLSLLLKDAAFSEKLPDFAVVRTIAPQLSARLEGAGVRVFNNAETSRIANDKYETYRLCKKLGLPVLPTTNEGVPPYPHVIKSVDGHGGAEVFRVENAAQRAAAIEALQGKAYISQTLCNITGRDMRAYAVGGECVAAVLRVSDRDFRSNFSLGGSVTLCQADEAQREMVRTLYRRLRFDFVGVDFLPDGKGGWYLNEIEDCAGARMLYKTSDIDIAAHMIARIKKTLVRD